MIEIKSPNTYGYTLQTRDGTVFLAGSIEMGSADLWQPKVVEALADTGAIIFNPRRDDWDSSWEQTIHNPYFKEQVTWELNHLGFARTIFMYFDPNTKSPITLLELGLIIAAINYSVKQKLILVCPHGFWRRGNLEVLADMTDTTIYNTLEEGIAALVEDIKVRNIPS